jgi:hypothetical protein
MNKQMIGLFIMALWSIEAYAVGLAGDLGLGVEQSPYSTSGLGKGQSGKASINKKSYNYYNPAAMAFNELTVFDVSFGVSSTLLKSWQDRGVQNDFTLKNIQMAVPLGTFGNLSASHYQRSQSNTFMNMSSSGQSNELSITGGLSEMIPAYAINVTDQISVGINYHLVSGNQRWRIEQPLTIDSENPTYQLITQQASYMAEHDVLNSGAYWGGSVHYHAQNWDISVNANSSAKVKREFQVNQYLSNDSLDDFRGVPVFFTEDKTLNAEIPWGLGFGAAVEPILGHEFSIDYQFTSAGDDIDLNPYLSFSPSMNQATQSWGLGWERKGSGRGFDGFFNKTIVRAGLFGRSFSMNNMIEKGASLGVGLPLGRRGAMIDLSYGFAHRGEGTLLLPNEYQHSVFFSFIGLGKWGEPSRRYR